MGVRPAITRVAHRLQGWGPTAWLATAVVGLLLVAVVSTAVVARNQPSRTPLDALATTDPPVSAPTMPVPTPPPTRTTAPGPATPTPRPAAPSPTPTEAAAATEVRAVWVHLFDDTLKSPASVDRLVDRVAAANANTLVVEVVRRQDAYYQSDILPRTRDPQVAADFDVLDRVIQRAHARGLAVHAWVPVMSAYHHVYDDIPRPAGWVWTDHGPGAPERDRWITRLADGTWSDHLDPGLPEVRRHVAAVMAEIAARYPVDGVHLDYVRYTSRDAGYHPRALARFREQTGIGGTPAPDDPVWSTWRRDQVTAMVREVRAAVRDADPAVALTAAVIAQGEGPTRTRPFAATRGYTDYFQDWVFWTGSGLLDAAFPMIYFDQRTHGAEFAQWADFLEWYATQVDALLVGGQAGYLNAPRASLDQLGRLSGADGVALYSYQQTADTEPLGVLLDRLPRSRWAEPADLPSSLRR